MGSSELWHYRVIKQSSYRLCIKHKHEELKQSKHQIYKSLRVNTPLKDSLPFWWIYGMTFIAGWNKPPEKSPEKACNALSLNGLLLSLTTLLLPLRRLLNLRVCFVFTWNLASQNWRLSNVLPAPILLAQTRPVCNIHLRSLPCTSGSTHQHSPLRNITRACSSTSAAATAAAPAIRTITPRRH